MFDLYIIHLTSIEIYSSYDHLSAHITHLLTLIIDSQFRFLSETFGFFRKLSATFGNIRVFCIYVGVACDAAAYLHPLKRLQLSKTFRVSSVIFFNVSLSLQTFSTEENVSVCKLKAKDDDLLAVLMEGSKSWFPNCFCWS